MGALGPPMTLLQRLVRLPLKLIPSQMVVPILRGPMRGKRWIAGASNHGCWLGSYEASKERLFRDSVGPGDCVYDLGANVGFYSLLASVLVGPKGRVFSFEPAPRNLAIIRRHLELNGITNCEVWDVAVSRSEGRASFELGSDPHIGHLTSGGVTDGLSVRTVALDGLVESGRLPPPNLIKCDIEGGEFDALTGATGILKRHRPTVLLATHGAEVHKKCCALLRNLRYKLTPLDASDLSQASELVAAPPEVELQQVEAVEGVG